MNQQRKSTTIEAWGDWHIKFINHRPKGLISLRSTNDKSVSFSVQLLRITNKHQLGQ